MLKYLAWILGLIVLFMAVMGATYFLTHRATPTVAEVLPTPMPVLPTLAPTPTPTPDSLSQTSDNPFDTSADYQNPFDSSNYQNPF